MNSIIEEMKRQQDATGTAPDPVIDQMRALNQATHSQAALAVSMQADQNADQAARHAQLAKRYNTTPEVVSAYPQEFKDRMTLEMARTSLADAPKLQQSISANPNTAAIIHDDLPNASAIERTVQPTQYMSEWRQPEQGETIRERMSNYWRGLFGVQSVQEEARGKREAEANAILAGRRGNPDLTNDQAFEVSRKAVGGMSPAAQIAAERFIDSASFGLAAPVNETKAHSWQQSVAGAGGQLAGFMVGPAKAAGMLINPLEKVAGESFVKGFSKSVINEAATLALATAAEKSGHALLDSTSVDQGVETIGNALEGGALMGATFGAAKKIFPDNTMPQWLARAVGVSAAQDYTEGTNPLDERVPLEDRLLKYFLNVAFTMHGGGRSEGGWLKDAAASKVAEQDFTQLTTLGQLSTASKWRERDPEGFKNFVRSTTEDGHLATVYVDGDVFMQSMEKAGMSPQELQQTMPELVAQIKEATETRGMVQIKTEDYATHIAGSKLDQELLQHLKTDPEGKTYSEAQAFYQEQATKMKEAAAGLVKEKTAQDAFRTSQEAVQTKIQENLDAVNRFPSNVNRINATVQSAILSRVAMREGITPEQAFEKYGAKVVGEGSGGFNQFAGVYSKTADRMQLDKAKEMLKAGRSPELVRRETGWHEGLDGELRYEIADDEAKFVDTPKLDAKLLGKETSEGGELSAADTAKVQELTSKVAELNEKLFAVPPSERNTYEWNKLFDDYTEARDALNVMERRRNGEFERLKDILDHPKLFAAYPELADTRIQFVKDADFRGSYNERDKLIKINVTGDKEQMLSTLLHEIQHAIQAREGFARGGSPEFTEHVKEALSHLDDKAKKAVENWKWANKDKLDAAGRAATISRYGLMYESAQRLIDYANRDKPSGVFRLIRNELQWIYHEQFDKTDTASELQRDFYAIPKSHKMRERNAFIGDMSFRGAQLLLGEIPAELRQQFKDDPRTMKDMINALQRESDKARKALIPLRDLEDQARTVKETKEAHKFSSPFNIYESLHGEVEARNTQTRQNMTEAERNDQSPFATADVPPHKIIVSFGGMDVQVPLTKGSFRQDAIEQTQTPEFRQWFGDSKVVDAEGKPLVVYHGTGKDFDTFDNAKTGTNDRGLWGRGHYFAANPDTANSYALREGDGARVIPAYVSIENPLVLKTGKDLITRLPDGTNTRDLVGQNLDGSKIKKIAEAGGHDGVIQLKPDGTIGDIVAFKPEQIKSVFNDKPTNDPSILKQDARGSYMPDERSIALLKDADLSTYLHETGHWALDIYTKIAQAPEASPEIRADVDKLLNWFGVESLEKWNSMSIDEQRPHHEQLARGFEAYLMEGKAPSSELAAVFARIRSWMLNIYKSLRNLNVELSPEVRGVFDRMLASDDAIAEAQAARVFEPLFKTKPEGMTDEEWKSYTELNDEATADAIADMQAKSLRDMKWLSGAKSRALKALQKQADTQRKGVEAEVTAEVEEMPLYAAERFLRKGETRSPNGDIIQVSKEGLPGTKFNTERIKEMYPESALDRPNLDKLKGMTGPKGLDPDLIADMFGFRSGDELVRKLIDMEPRESVIEGLTDKRMLEEHGELATPQGIEAAANEAVHNDARARFIATGLKVLANSPIPARELVRGAREAAEGATAAKKVRDLNPRQYEAAETKANKEAIKLAAKDPAQAIQAQRASLLNNQLAKATRKAQEDVQKAIDHFKRLGKDAAQDAMRGEYLSQLNDLLARFDLRTSVKPSAESRLPLGEWVQAEAERLSAVMPDLPEWVLNEGYRTHYSELSVEQLRGLRDTVKQLEHMARREQKQYMAIRAMEFAAERDEVLGEIRSNWKKAFDEDGLPKGIEPDFVPSLKKSISKLGDKFAGEFLNPETILSILGGGKFTVVNESLFGRLSARSDWKAEKLTSLYKELKPLFDAYSVKEKYDFARKDIATPAGLDTPLTRENALVVALLHGNADGRERLTNYGWNEGQQQKIIGLLDAKDRELANAIWRMFDHTLWPELKKLNDDTRGKAPPKVEAVPYSTTAGEWSGGYFKLKYDTALDERAHRIDEGQAVKELLGNGMGMGAKTNQGSSTERKQQVRLRPRLDLGVFSEAINETVHDLAYREAVADTMRMLNDKGIQNAVKQVVGNEGYRALVGRVREVAAPPRNPSGYVETAISVARRNTVINLMSGVKTALQNLTGLAPALAEINAGTLGAEIARFYSPKMVERYEFAMEHSAYMRQRFTNYDRDLNTQIKKLTVNGSFRPDESTFLGLMGFVDKGVSVPVWNAAFKQGMEKFTNDVSKSVDYADHIVRQTQGSGRDVDLAQIMSGHGGWGQLKKAFTMFYSYFNGQLNLLTKHAVMSKLEAENGSTAAASGKMAAKLIAIVAIPTILTELLMHGYSQDGETDEERSLRFAGAFVKYGAGFFPFVRDIVPGIWAQATGDHFITPKISALDSAIEGVVKAGKSVGDVMAGENDERDTKNLIMGVGYLVGAPGKLISDTVDGTRAWLNGDAGPQAILLGPPKK